MSIIAIGCHISNLVYRVFRINVFFVIWSYGFALLCFAQQAKGAQINFTQLLISQKPTHAPVTSIVQDHWGFMWFAGGHQVSRYDGYSLSHYPFAQTNDELSLLSLLVSREGFLWASTTQGLYQFDVQANAFVAVNLQYQQKPQPISINVMVEDEQGVLWLGCNDGVVQFNPTTGQSQLYQVMTSDGQPSAIWSLYLSQSGVLWAGGNQGVLKFDKTNQQFQRVINAGPVLAIGEDNQGLLWVGSDQGLKLYDMSSTGEQNLVWQGLTSSVITSVWQDKSGDMWLGSLQGLYRVESELLVAGKTKPELINVQSTLTVFQDDMGLLWVGTNAGVSKSRSRLLPSKSYFSLREADGEKHPLPVSAMHFVDDVIWLGSRGGGLSWFAASQSNYDQRQTFVNNAQLSSAQVTALQSDQQGFLWVGTLEGLSRINLETNEVKRFVHQPANLSSIISNEVISIRSTRRGELWIGTENGLAQYDYDSESFSNYGYQDNNDNGLSHYRVMAIEEDAKGKLWLGTGHGISRFDVQTKQFDKLRIDGSDTNWFGVNVILSSHFDEQLGLWFGTNGGGLAHFDSATGTFRHYKKADGISSQTVLGITSTNHYIWLATSQGIDRFDSTTETFTSYSLDQLNQDTWFVPRAIARDDKQGLYFGGYDFLLELDAKKLSGQVNEPKLAVIEALATNSDGTIVNYLPVNYLPVNSSDEPAQITLPHQHHQLTFKFALLDYANPSNNHYRYKLIGADDGWKNVDAKVRHVHFEQLASGNYQFHLQARSGLSSWWDNEQVITVVVEYPLGRRWWAYCLYLMVVMLPVFGYLRKRRLKPLVVKPEVVAEITDKESKETESILVEVNTPKPIPQNIEPQTPQPLQALSEKDQAFVDKVDDVIALNYTDSSFNLVKMSSQLAMSERQLRRKLKALCDCGPTEYLRRYRLNEAKVQLLTGERVNVVADAVGFSSATYMSNCFKAQFGVSPGQYQKNHRQN